VLLGQVLKDVGSAFRYGLGLHATIALQHPDHNRLRHAARRLARESRPDGLLPLVHVLDLSTDERSCSGHHSEDRMAHAPPSTPRDG
jgi:hypothetical protein